MKEVEAKEKPVKKKKSVGFALEQNTVLEFDKTKKIVETEGNVVLITDRKTV